ncbi:hypothetical protein QQX13_02450 [Demequina sp. SYSU T00068]|uniref:hypothetical protein n=1 Tax=Demequina lignilytica TaxID=3051663 RepID=UPI00260ACF46|nr:hypothetical protein [Demequina sp. SYSU T00068]MDN4489685.1 hypothetical protein [Demequina sp. SYSU T00068]
MTETDLPGLEVLVYSWATKTLEGSGFGVVGVSDGWPHPRSIRATPLERVVGRDGAGNGEASYAYVRDHAYGPILVMKRYLGNDPAGRPGRYVAEVVCARNGELRAVDAINYACRLADTLDWPVDAAPSTSLHLPTAAATAPSRVSPEAVAQVLQVLSTHRVGAFRFSAGELASALAILPSPLVEGVSFATQNLAPLTSGPALVLGGTPSPHSEGYGAYLSAAESIVNEPAAESDVGSVSELLAWLRHRDEDSRDPMSLGTVELVGAARRATGLRFDLCMDSLAERVVRGEIDDSYVRSLPIDWTASLAARLLRDPTVQSRGDAVALARRSGADEHQIYDAMLSSLSRRYDSDSPDVGRATPAELAMLADYFDTYMTRYARRTQLATILADPWAFALATGRWAGSAHRVVREFWTVGDAPLYGIEGAAAELLVSFPHETAAVLASRPASVARLEVAVRALPPGGYLGAAAAVIARSGVPSPFGPPLSEKWARSWRWRPRRLPRRDRHQDGSTS